MTGVAMPVVNVTVTISQRADAVTTRSEPLVPIPSYASTLDPGTCTGFACDGDFVSAPSTLERIKHGGNAFSLTNPFPSITATIGPFSCTPGITPCPGIKSAPDPGPVKHEEAATTRSEPLVPIPSFASTLDPGTCTGFNCAGEEVEATPVPKLVKREDAVTTRSEPLVPPATTPTLGYNTCTGFAHCDGSKVVEATAGVGA
ncbi:hypothetical protein ACLMJK_009144 [Lecanora helva]